MSLLSSIDDRNSNLLQDIGPAKQQEHLLARA